MDKHTETIKRRYNRTALYYDCMDVFFNDTLRQRVLSKAYGKVLEVGVGTGKNLPLYPSDCQITGIDFSPNMLAKARQRVDSLGLNITLLEQDAQNLDFPDNTFDTVTATCVFCSVPDPIKGFQEIKRVCKDGGKILLLEHVRSKNPILGPIMDILNPLSLYMIGSNINRRTINNIQEAGLKIVSNEDVMGKIVKLVVATP